MTRFSTGRDHAPFWRIARVSRIASLLLVLFWSSGCVLVHGPRFSLGLGELHYSEHDSDLVPGLDTDFDEFLFHTRLGWEFVTPFVAFHIDGDFFQTTSGTESIEDFDILVQENDLQTRRSGLEIGVLGSTWDRTAHPADIDGPGRFFRFSGGVDFYYRHQQFERDEFVLFDPLEFLDLESEETFDMVGGELVLDFEFGPREFLAPFVRLRGGGGYVGVENDVFGSLADEARIDTAGVQGTFEVGGVCTPVEFLDIRFGFRHHRMEVFGEDENVRGVLIVELPDNTTRINMAFVEVALLF